jgi:hypothetical protein
VYIFALQVLLDLLLHTALSTNIKARRFDDAFNFGEQGAENEGASVHYRYAEYLFSLVHRSHVAKAHGGKDGGDEIH